MTGVLRDLDAFDYAVVAALALLFYLQSPWRPAVRRSLRSLAGAFAAADPGSGTLAFGADAVAVAVVLVAAAALAAIGVAGLWLE